FYVVGRGIWMNDKKKIIIIGGGPAGLMAAGQAASHGADTIILEKMNRVGIKLGITGKGRCNLTNIADLSDFITHFGKTGRFLRQSFSRFFNTDLMDFFTNRGVDLITERGGRVFPKSGKAQDILRTLKIWIQELGVEIRYNSPVSKIVITNGNISAVVVNGKEISCNSLILATGGASYPATGSNGDGYILSEAVGHSIIPVHPALVPLELFKSYNGVLDKLNLRNINVKMYINGKKKREEFGEIVFTKFGVSGPVILSFSGDVVDSLRKGQKVSLSIDLKPALDDKKLDARILRDIALKGKESVSSFLKGLLPSQMVPVYLECTGIPATRRVCDVSSKERKLIRNRLKDFKLEVSGYRPFSEAIITSGGVNTLEIDPRTMESRIVKGLYFAGEVIDIQADTGGFNLQATLSTGWLAGQSSGKE
ncbi:MAG: NAD(P)/FAD-dependent oxidoreductase, partial [Spirochaetaceae bacterium]|nr:NAD(P)/FAD-dependent oxidoreductase [Spirochaetaceae bacterium]